MTKNIVFAGLAMLIATTAMAENADKQNNENISAKANTEEQTLKGNMEAQAQPKKKSRFTIGGYGEAVYTRGFYSDHFNRYVEPETYKDYPGHGRFDLPHVCINMGYDFGKGWTMGTEIEFEHGGTESAVEMDADETGEYEAETEKGGEVGLEQFWINKAFWQGKFNIKAGNIIVPVGLTNAHHEPMNFFTCYRNEGENTIFPCTWNQVGVSLWGNVGDWRYEAQFLSGLNSDQFGSESFIHYGATSSYEFKVANSYAGVLRIDNYSVKGLRIGLSGYYGRSFRNTLKQTVSAKYDGVTGTVAIGAFDFTYNNHGWIARGNFDYAYLSDADAITTYNKNMAAHSQQDGSPSKHQCVGKNAIAAGCEFGYDIFRFFDYIHDKGNELYPFAHYEYYNSMSSGTYSNVYKWCGKHRVAFGLNYKPMKEIVVKAEWSKRILPKEYNNEPSISLSIAYEGFFKM